VVTYLRAEGRRPKASQEGTRGGRANVRCRREGVVRGAVGRLGLPPSSLIAMSGLINFDLSRPSQ
jgi:hypothetical protein